MTSGLITSYLVADTADTPVLGVGLLVFLCPADHFMTIHDTRDIGCMRKRKVYAFKSQSYLFPYDF